MNLKRIFFCPYIPEATNAGFVNQMFWLLCLTVLPSLVVVIYSSVKIHSYTVEMFSFRELMNTFEPFENSKVAVATVLEEMLGVVTNLATASTSGGNYPSMNEIYEKTDAQMRNFDAISMRRDGYRWTETRGELLHELKRIRLQEGDFKRTNLMFVVGIYQELINGMTFSPTTFIFSTGASSIPLYTAVAENLMNSYIRYGLVDSLGVSYFLRGYLSDEERLSFEQHLQIAESELEEAIRLNGAIKMYWNVKQDQLNIFWEELRTSEREILEDANPVTHGPSRAANWIERNGLRSIILNEMMKQLEIEMTHYLEDKHSNVLTLLIIHIACLCLATLLILPLSFLGSVSTAKSLRSYIQLVEKKSLEIRKEKRKTEHLLHEMLPKSMAFRLQKGEQIYAEQFHSVTVFFSDIADFTEISTRSVPIDIVSFLNDVYNFIDSLIVKYDVYKVETINCVYMVSSGIPSRNGDRHCVEIARLSIDLIKACEEFVIPHLKNHKLQLRIGVHTGPAVGGIVGNKMPRYCLFGDTVNTASRMQANGLPHKIHITEDTNEALKVNGGFRTELRGSIEVKGKGLMITYWLLGRD